MKTTITGPYPRVGSELGNKLRKEINNGTVSKELATKLSNEIIKELFSAGIDIPNSGLVEVHDELSWPLEFASGIEFGGMKKIFHTNTHYREPIVVGEIKQCESTHFDVIENTKIELPGPYTLATLSVEGAKHPYKNFKEIAHAYAQFLKDTVYTIQGIAPLIQFNEPSVIAHGKQKEDLEILPELYAHLLDGIKQKTAVWTFYGQYDEKTLDILLSLPVDAVGLDFVWHPEVAELLKKKSPQKGIGFGIIDCGDRGYIGIENAPKIVEQIKKLEGHVDFEKSYISTNATLGHLPRDYARKKAELIGQIKYEVSK